MGTSRISRQEKGTAGMDLVVFEQNCNALYDNNVSVKRRVGSLNVLGGVPLGLLNFLNKAVEFLIL